MATDFYTFGVVNLEHQEVHEILANEGGDPMGLQVRVGTLNADVIVTTPTGPKRVDDGGTWALSVTLQPGQKINITNTPGGNTAAVCYAALLSDDP